MRTCSGKSGPFRARKSSPGEPQQNKPINRNPTVQALSSQVGGQDSVERMIGDGPQAKQPDELSAFLANALSQVSDAVIISDIEHRITYLNRAAERLYGFTAQEVRGRTIEEVYHYRWLKPEDEKAAWDSPGAIGSWHGENLHTTKSGKEIFVDLSVNLLKDESGSAIGFLTLIRDITERKRAEDVLRRTRDEAELRIQERAAELAKTNQALKAELEERKQIELTLREERTRLLHIYNSALDLMFLISAEPEECFRYLSVNKSYLARTGFSEAQLIGKRVEEVFRGAAAAFVLTKLREAIRAGKSIQYEVTFDLPLGPGIFETTLTPIFDQTGRCTRLFGVAHDATARKQAEDALRQLSGRLLKVQDEERRRTGRELHDTLGQNLIALAMNLAIMEESTVKLDRRAREALAQSHSLTSICLDEVRTLSYLLYPPLLDEMGLEPALRWYAKGFTQRSGIQIDVDVPPALGRMPQEVESALFRIVQESLTNVHRHSGSPTAQVRIVQEASGLTLQVKDEGRGLLGGTLGEGEEAIARLGVGIRGMQERMRQVGGRLEIESSGKGTTVRAILPLSEAHS